MSVADLRNYTADDALQKILEALERGRHRPDTGLMLCALLLHRDLERIAMSLEAIAGKAEQGVRTWPQR